MSALQKKKIDKKTSANRKRRVPSDNESIAKTHKEFVAHLCKMPKPIRDDIILQMRDDAEALSIMEQAEIDPSPFPTEEQYQQMFFDATGWYYPDESYVTAKIKDRF